MDFLTAEEVEAIKLSLKIALWAMAISSPFAVLVALILARMDFIGKNLLNAAVHLPLILPPVVTGYMLLLLFGRRGPIGEFLNTYLGFSFSFRWTGAALACGIMGFPLIVRTIRLSIESVDTKLEEAASTLGASPLYVFMTITLPLIAPGILAGMILSFARAIGEFGATITFVSNIPGETRTLPVAIYTFTQIPGGDAGAIRLTVISIFISIAALCMSEIMARKIRIKTGMK